MRVNNQNRIRVLRSTIAELTRVLEAKLVFDEDYTGSDIKSSVKVKKNAFLRAKYLLGKLQQLETEEARNSNATWYKETLESLISAAEGAMEELASIMRRKVNRDESSSSVNSAIDAKQEAYDYMDDIFSGVLELQTIVKAIDEGEGVKPLNANDFKSGLAEEHAYYGFYPIKERKVQPGYNKELDAIVISYDGTIGEIVDCYGLRIALPKAPSKAKMPNGRKKKALQHWERPTLPEGLSPETAHLFRDEIEEEFRRRDEGYWFMNNGEPEYITGVHYMLMTHYKTDAEDEGHFHFRKAHRDLLYFLEAAWVDERSLGVILGKTRRTGATYIAAAFSLTKAISTRDALFGLTSKKDPDAKKVFEKISHMFKHLPFFFKPLNTGEGLSKSLSFTTPSRRTTKLNQKKDVQYDDLNTVMDYQATMEDSYDSLAVRFYIGDELSKWLKYNTLTHWSKIRKALMKGRNIHGKAFLLSTVEYVTGEDHNSDRAKSGDRFKHLFYESDVSKRNANGMTNSGLYKIFISSLDNYEGYIDMYGNCISHTPPEPVLGVDGKMITDGVYDFLQGMWSAYKHDAAALNDEKRKDPITESDMFRIASEDSMFNIMKIQDQMDYNTNRYLATGKWGYKTGNFRRKNDGTDDIEFYETPKGRFQVSWLPDEHIANAKVIKGGKIAPKYDFLGCIGIDPYKVHKVKYGTGSKGSIIGYLGNHPVAGVPKEQFFLVYIGRPQSLDIFFDDAIMAMMYYSMQGLIENNINELLKVMHARGYTRYAMRRPDKLKLTIDESMYGGIPGTDPSLLKNQASYLERYIEDHVGYATDNTYRPMGEIGNCPFNDLLADFAKFDLGDREKFDATVSACLAVYGAQKFLLKNQRQRDNSNAKIKATDFYYLS
jgi:hypothetical protein